ncbi:hypothetical protein ACLX1H_009408 [Fusarium chlamydosporum]
MSIYYLLIDGEDPDHHSAAMSQSMIPYLLGTLAFLFFVWYHNSAMPAGAGPHHRETVRFEFSEACYEEKIIYLMTQMRWWDYYRGLWVMQIIVNLGIVCQTYDWPYTFSVTYLVTSIAYNYGMAMAFALAEIQVPSIWAKMTGGHRIT